MSEAISIKGLSFAWPGSLAPVLEIPELNIEQGKNLFLLGSSGSGKSTLLNLIAGMLKVQTGTLDVFGSSLHSLSNRQRDRFRAEHIGFIFQQFNLVPYLDVETNIAVSAKLAGMKAQECKSKTEALLDTLLIDPSLLRRRADQLSVGQQQRVAVARAMINDPQLIIADEPTSSLDQDARDEFIDLLLTTQKRTAATVLFVSHDRSLIRHFDDVIRIDEINTALGSYKNAS